jgi:hypothetical protein
MTYRVICDRTGKKLFRRECEIEWDGLLVWKEAIDPFPEYLIPPPTQENIGVQLARPEPPDVFTVPSPNDL